jgi:transposase InsO family protein
VSPITDLLKGSEKGKKTGPFSFPEPARQAFQELKKAFATAPVLQHLNPEFPIRLQTDALGFALSGILSQPKPGIETPTNRHWHPVAYWSRKMIDAERCYETYDQELLAIVECFKEWRHYLEGSVAPIEVLSDHNNLRHFMTTKRLNPRQVRWALTLGAFDFEIKHTPGKTNPADAPSCRPDFAPQGGQDLSDLLPTFHRKIQGDFMKAVTAWVRTEPASDAAMFRLVKTGRVTVTMQAREMVPEESRDSQGSTDRRLSGSGVHAVEVLRGCRPAMPRMLARVCAASENPPEDPLETLQDALLLLQQGDALAKGIRRALEAGRRWTGAEKGDWTINRRGLLERDEKIYIPPDEAMRQELLRIHHDDPLAGHQGAVKTTELLRRKFYWKALAKDVGDYVMTCDDCQRSKSRRHLPYSELSPLPLPSGPWKEITMDFITGLPPSRRRGNEYDALLVVVDRYTKMARYIPCNKTVDAIELASILEDEIFGKFGPPNGIVSDRGSVFTSTYWSNICYHLKIKRRLSTAFHPQTDGLMEGQNQTLEAYLRAYCNDHKDDWASFLWMAEFAYNNAIHSATKEIPFRAMYGYAPDLPVLATLQPPDPEVPSVTARIGKLVELRKTLERNWLNSAEAMEKLYNKHHRLRRYNKGEYVFLGSRNIKFKTPPKLTPKYLGPFLVLDIIGTQAYKLALPPLYSRLHPVFHVSLLEPAQLRPGFAPSNATTPELADQEGEELYEIESIVDHRERADGIQFRVRWKGWSRDYDEWIHEGHLNADRAIKKYGKHLKGDGKNPEQSGKTLGKRKRDR